jgi:hypothetical protein
MSRMVKQCLGRSMGWFRAHKDELEKAGFPKPLAVTGLYDPDHVMAWRAAQNSITQQANSPVDLGALHGGR